MENKNKQINLSSETSIEKIPEQPSVSWQIAFTISWGSLKRRFLRSLVTMLGVILAISFLTYMQIMNNITKALVAAHDNVLNVILQKAGVDIFAVNSTDKMMVLLITLSLLACLVGIVNSMLMSVSERIKEIGTLKCLGALDTFILKTYFIESLLQGVLGTLIGIILGIVVAITASFMSYKYYVYTYFPIIIVMKSILISMIVGTLLSVFASLAPAYMAARKEPVDAMRTEE